MTAPFRMQPALRRVAPGAAQLTPSVPGDRHLREKLAVLGSAPLRALCAVAPFDDTAVLRAIGAEAARSCPEAFRVEAGGDGALRCQAPLLGWSVEGDAIHGEGDPAIGDLLQALPLHLRRPALVSLAFAEDFAVLDGASATVPWLAVCLPSHWAPEDKVGRTFAEVHAPVADGDLLRAAGASLARLVTGDERWERFVWTVTADPRLHQHPARGHAEWPEPQGDDATADAAALVAMTSLRSERQTFVPITGRGQAVFTILVDSVALADAVTTANAARRLHDAIASMSAAVLAYRRLDRARDRLLRWLAARAAGDPVPE
nr:heme-dependent oxidative N-demethylase subunit alpha family protein [Caldimonas sp.]